jgi:hypothetical protein
MHGRSDHHSAYVVRVPTVPLCYQNSNRKHSLYGGHSWHATFLNGPAQWSAVSCILPRFGFVLPIVELELMRRAMFARYNSKMIL